MAVRLDNRWQCSIIFLSVIGHVIQPIFADNDNDGHGVIAEDKPLLRPDLHQERIVGGDIARPGDWPWMAITFVAGQQWCGGTLIDPKHILTASHCFYDVNPSDVVVHLGDYNTATNDEVRHIERRVKKIIVAPDFDNVTLINDITILTMDEPVKFTNAIKPIRLPSGSQLYTGEIGAITGWGCTRINGTVTSVLRQVAVPIIANSECGNQIAETFVCVTYPGISVCEGDSGGPLMVNENAQWIQVGVASWRSSHPGQPSAFTRVTKYLPWIRENLK